MQQNLLQITINILSEICKMKKVKRRLNWTLLVLLVFLFQTWVEGQEKGNSNSHNSPPAQHNHDHSQAQIPSSDSRDQPKSDDLRTPQEIDTKLPVTNDDIIQEMERKRFQGQSFSKGEFDKWIKAFLATTVVSIIPIFLVFVLPCLSDDSNPSKKQALKTLVSFAVGGLLGDVFLHLLPHSVPEPHGNNNHFFNFSFGSYIFLHST